MSDTVKVELPTWKNADKPHKVWLKEINEYFAAIGEHRILSKDLAPTAPEQQYPEVGTPAAAGSGQAKPERKRHGSAGKGTRQKQESMRNALRQLRRELHKVQAQPAVAARLEKENAASPELGAA